VTNRIDNVLLGLTSGELIGVDVCHRKGQGDGLPSRVAQEVEDIAF